MWGRLPSEWPALERQSLAICGLSSLPSHLPPVWAPHWLTPVRSLKAWNPFIWFHRSASWERDQDRRQSVDVEGFPKASGTYPNVGVRLFLEEA